MEIDYVKNPSWIKERIVAPSKHNKIGRYFISSLLCLIPFILLEASCSSLHPLLGKKKYILINISLYFSAINHSLCSLIAFFAAILQDIIQ